VPVYYFLSSLCQDCSWLTWGAVIPFGLDSYAFSQTGQC
jgi:hypothetical protein